MDDDRVLACLESLYTGTRSPSLELPRRRNETSRLTSPSADVCAAPLVTHSDMSIKTVTGRMRRIFTLEWSGTGPASSPL
jgi:hypothetical protein